MTRFRGAAALLAAVVLTALVGAGAATAAPPRLSPSPPVPLPSHVGRPHQHKVSPAKPLPKTGLSLAPVLLTATALLALGAGLRTIAVHRLI